MVGGGGEFGGGESIKVWRDTQPNGVKEKSKKCKFALKKEKGKVNLHQWRLAPLPRPRESYLVRDGRYRLELVVSLDS